MTSFEGRVAAVTGAGSGIGRALAIALAERGAKLAISDVDTDGLTQTGKTLEGIGAETHSAEVDVSDREAVEGWATAVVDHFGGVNQIYNNAGIAFARPVVESTYDDYERVFGVNLWGVIHGTKAFLPHLIDSGEGHVVNISSLNGYMAQNEMSHYCATKFAVRGFTESLRIEMTDAGHRVGVTSVHPGGIDTNIATKALELAREIEPDLITAEHEARRDRYNEKLLRMPASEAARIILDGVVKNRVRVRVGKDAVAVDLLTRLVPSLMPRISLGFSRRALG